MKYQLPMLYDYVFIICVSVINEQKNICIWFVYYFFFYRINCDDKLLIYSLFYDLLILYIRLMNFHPIFCSFPSLRFFECFVCLEQITNHRHWFKSNVLFCRSKFCSAQHSTKDILYCIMCFGYLLCILLSSKFYCELLFHCISFY